MKGFVKVDRELFESELWTLDLSVRAAYIDLMRRAAWRPVAAFVNGKNLTIEKGQCIVSQRILSDDWACKRSTVVSILRRLVGLNLISLHSIFDDAKRNNGYTIITLCHNISTSAVGTQCQSDGAARAGRLAITKTAVEGVSNDCAQPRPENRTQEESSRVFFAPQSKSQVVDNSTAQPVWLSESKNDTDENELSSDSQGSSEIQPTWLSDGEYQQLTTPKTPPKNRFCENPTSHSNIKEKEEERRREEVYLPHMPPQGGDGSLCSPKRERAPRASNCPPALLDWLAYARSIGWDEWQATESFHYWDGVGWQLRTGQKIRSWKPICSKSKMYFQQKAKNGGVAPGAELSCDNPPVGWRRVYSTLTGLDFTGGISWADIVSQDPTMAKKVQAECARINR